jgi:ribosomal protein S18 acetylase RimI-like enzyme
VSIEVRNTQPEDFPAITALSEKVYPNEPPWSADYLRAHLDVFPEGQLVAVDAETGEVVGMAASLRLAWEEYDDASRFVDATSWGKFDNHDPEGPTLYGAEVMVDPERRRQGIGRALYAARRDLARRLGVKRIVAGARLPGYGAHADEMSAEQYVEAVARGELADPTLSFQLSEGFSVVGVIPRYQRLDEKSRGYAALIEWRTSRR